MQRQRNTSHVKEQEESPEKDLSKMEASELLDAAFQTMVMGMVTDLHRIPREA